MNSPNEIILYNSNDSVQLEVLLNEETVWLTQSQMATLFGRNQSVISRHINNVIKEGELYKDSVYANFATTASDGKTYFVDYYNLDVIISVGYRVKSQRGTEFRIWATKTLKQYLLKGYAINQRFENIDSKLSQHEQKLLEHQKQIDFIVHTELPPKEGLFYNGQIFDAYVFVSKLIKTAKKSIVLIDNYINESTLLLLSKRQKKVHTKIYTKELSQQLQLDLSRHNAQYETINIYKSNSFHDRFLIIDDTVYHIGASLKDLGKKLFAFSKMEIKADELFERADE